MPHPTARDPPGASLLRHPAFALFWLARLATTVSAQMQAVAVGWQAYELTDSAFDLGLVGLAQFVPFILLVLVVGHVADRFDRRAVLVLTRLVQALTMAVLTIGAASHLLGFGGLLVLVAALGAARAFDNPTASALLPGLVARPVLARALALSASANQTATIVGPALGGMLYVLGPATVYGSSTVLAALGGLLVALIRNPGAALTRTPPTLASLFAGLAFIGRHRPIFGAISLDLIGVLLGGATALLPIFARDILHTGPWGLGLLRAGPALGALLVSLLLARRPLRRRVGRRMFAAVAAFGAATIVFGLSHSLALSLAALAVTGAADLVSVVIRQTLIQIETPDAMRGRVSAVSSLFVGTSNLLGEFESGVTAAWFGTVPAVLIGGTGTILAVLLWMRLFPGLRRVDRFEEG